MVSTLVSTALFFSAISLSTSENSNFTLTNISLPYQEIYDFGYAIYNDSLKFFRGKYLVNPNIFNNRYEYSLPLNNSSTLYASNWSYILPSTANVGSPSILQYSNEQMVQIGSLVYGFNIRQNASSSITAYTYQMEIYDLNDHSYLDLNGYNSLFPVNVSAMCVVTDGVDLIYSIGGYSSYNNNNMIYNISSDKWTIMKPNVIPRLNAGCSFDMNKENIYLFSGDNIDLNNRELKSIEQYNIDNDEWKLLQDVTIPYATQRKCILYPKDECIYCIGGLGGYPYTQPINAVYIFNPINFEINTIYVKYGRTNPAAVVYKDDCMLVFGGNSLNQGPRDNHINALNCNFDSDFLNVP